MLELGGIKIGFLAEKIITSGNTKRQTCNSPYRFENGASVRKDVEIGDDSDQHHRRLLVNNKHMLPYNSLLNCGLFYFTFLSPFRWLWSNTVNNLQRYTWCMYTL